MSNFDTRALIDYAMGRIKADIILKGGRVVNVYTREIFESDIVIAGGKIVNVGKDTQLFEGKNTLIIDVKDFIICPGLIESHIHIESSMLTLSEFAKAIIPHGTTTVVIDPHELVNVVGTKGLKILFKEAKLSPIRFLIEAPSCVPALPGFETSGAVINSKKIRKLMKRKEIFALAEMMNYPGVFLADDDVIAKINASKEAGKIIEGHAPLLKNKELQAYIAAGISSDHEATNAEEVLEKLRLGMKLQIREGSFARDLVKIFEGFKKSKIDTRNILIASDDRNPLDLTEKGHLDYSLKLLIQQGIEPVEALQMMTLNTATHLGLQDEIGGIAPGKCADIVVFDNLDNLSVSIVIAQGKILFRDGKMKYEQPKFNYPSQILNTTKNLQVPTEGELKIQSSSIDKVNARVIGIKEKSLITEKLVEDLEVKNGMVQPSIEKDILPLVVINRHTKERNIGKAFIKGLGIKNGAIASTVAHDSHQLICAGTDYKLMIKAINELKISKGGQVVVTPTSTTILPLEFAGIMSTLPLEELVEKFKKLQTAVMEIKPIVSEPFMALAFVALPVIPHIKLTDKGLFDVDEFRIVDPVT